MRPVTCGRRRTAAACGRTPACAWVYNRCRRNQPPCAVLGADSRNSPARRQAECERNRQCVWKRWQNRPACDERCYIAPAASSAPCALMDPAMERTYWRAVDRIQTPLAGNVYTAPSPGRGRGVFAARPFRRGERITTYHGTLVPDGIVRRRSSSENSHVRTLLPGPSFFWDACPVSSTTVYTSTACAPPGSQRGTSASHRMPTTGAARTPGETTPNS